MTYRMTEYNTDREPVVTNWTTKLLAIDTARTILASQQMPSDMREFPHVTILGADPRCGRAVGTSVFTIVESR